MNHLATITAAAGLAAIAAAHADADGIEVDLELVLMVDVSRSMTENELEIQRLGYAAALQTDAVYAAVQSGMLGRVALSYVEWAGTQQVIVDWRLLETREDLAAFADTLSANFNPALRRTSISEALLFGAEMIENNEYAGLRKVIDISGDGPNNDGRPVTFARDRVLAEGITINGLPLLTREGMGSQWHLEHLDIYYETCVIGGPGAFVVPVLDWQDFAEAVRRKLVLEMASQSPAETLRPAQMLLRDPYDCMIGEKMWQERRRYWDYQ
ncbi:DUF1194 domain-containing protein [Tropicimonas sp. IMCC6043]|uniref:DUF1194 domain-containing protein n=1 Tax=Tropicimonas sp. IMCC6043 TaxID=2510645 RepID=UPI00101D9A4E|nr:DUF1194 domain-containing protein [Tropicimonas sp. IMCC6043]RYH12215.1 DUF1194 domain-containing protein [Tropicimonas sp. IMCC6043]